MSNKRDRPDRLHRWLGTELENRNVSSLSDSSDRGSATSSISVSSTAKRSRPSPLSVSSSKTNSVAVVTAEESSANQSRKNGSSETSSDLSGSKRYDEYKDDSHSPLIHVHKRRKKVNIDSSSSEEKNESAEASSASSDTSEKDDSSSSSLLYKRGTANSNVKTFVSLRKKQQEKNSSSNDGDQNGPPTSVSRAQHQREELGERDQNDGSSSSSSHDATISKLSSSSYSQSINSASDTKADAYASSYSSPPSDTSDQDNVRQAKDIADDAADSYEKRRRNKIVKDCANSPEEAVNCNMKTYTDSSESVSASSDTSDPESTGTTSESSSIKRKKVIVGNAMQVYQASSSSATAFDVCSTSSTSTSSTTKRKKIIISNVLQTYQNSLSFATTDGSEGSKEEEENVEDDTATKTQEESFLSSSSPSSSTSSSLPANKETKDEGKSASIVAANGNYQSSLSFATIDTSEDDKVEIVKVVHDGVEPATKTSEESLASSSSLSSSTRSSSTTTSSQPINGSTKDESKPTSTMIRNGNNGTVTSNTATVKASIPTSARKGPPSLDSISSQIEGCMYRDHSHITVEIAESSIEWKDHPHNPLAFLIKDPPFPQKLHRILADPDVQEWVHWLPHGRAWKILNQKKLDEFVLPKYFKQCKLASFMRQVNTWGFKRIPSGPDENAYYNELFLRGMPHLSLRMRRQPRGKLEERMKSVFTRMHVAPDFYQLSKDHPLPEVLPNSSSVGNGGSHLSPLYHSSTTNGYTNGTAANMTLPGNQNSTNNGKDSTEDSNNTSAKQAKGPN